MSESGPRRDFHQRIPELAKEHVLEQTGDEEESDFEFVGHGGVKLFLKYANEKVVRESFAPLLPRRVCPIFAVV
ncbi:MAG: hypothetical protein HQ488_02590 [Parcubacteria group bacterium]|nr:hypothetical protein [Parcubacteria group bacterium]